MKFFLLFAALLFPLSAWSTEAPPAHDKTWESHGGVSTSLGDLRAEVYLSEGKIHLYLQDADATPSGRQLENIKLGIERKGRKTLVLKADSTDAARAEWKMSPPPQNFRVSLQGRLDGQPVSARLIYDLSKVAAKGHTHGGQWVCPHGCSHTDHPGQCSLEGCRMQLVWKANPAKASRRK